MKKRSKYRPKRVLINPISYVIESLTPIAEHYDSLINLKIKNSQSMFSLLHGCSTVIDMATLRDMSNMTEAFCIMNFGKEHFDIVNKGRNAIFTIVERAGKVKKFIPTGLEIQALNDLIELHNAQIEIVTIRDMEKAISLVKHKIAYAKDTIKLDILET